MAREAISGHLPQVWKPMEQGTLALPRGQQSLHPQHLGGAACVWGLSRPALAPGTLESLLVGVNSASGMKKCCVTVTHAQAGGPLSVGLLARMLRPSRPTARGDCSLSTGSHGCSP